MAELGQYFLYLGIMLTWISFFLHWRKKTLEKPNLNFYIILAGTIFMWVSYTVLLKAFIDRDYNFIIVHGFSDDSMSTTERIMAAWASRQGAMILWSALMNTILLNNISGSALFAGTSRLSAKCK